MARRGPRGRPIYADRAGGRQPADPPARLGRLLVAGRPRFLPTGHEVGGWPRWHEAAGAASSLLCRLVNLRRPQWGNRYQAGTQQHHREKNDQACYPADSAQPPPPDAAGAASGRARGDTRGVRLVRWTGRAEASRPGAQPRPVRAGARRGRRAAEAGRRGAPSPSPSFRAAARRGHRASPATSRAASPGPRPDRQPDSAGQRRRPGRRQQWRPQRWRRQHLAAARRTAPRPPRSRSRCGAAGWG
jgi:hypothetical protein